MHLFSMFRCGVRLHLLKMTMTSTWMKLLPFFMSLVSCQSSLYLQYIYRRPIKRLKLKQLQVSWDTFLQFACWWWYSMFKTSPKDDSVALCVLYMGHLDILMGILLFLYMYCIFSSLQLSLMRNWVMSYELFDWRGK